MSKNSKLFILLVFFRILVTPILYAETGDNTPDQCPETPSTDDSWDLRKMVTEGYKKEGLKVPDWDHSFFEEEYTYSDLWKKIANKFYDSFAKKYNIPLNWFLFKLFKRQDFSAVCCSRGKVNYCNLANDWLSIGEVIEPVYPEIAQWLRKKINNPKQRLRMPKSTIESDLKDLVVGVPWEDEEKILGLDLSPGGTDLTFRLIEYAKKLKEALRKAKSQRNKPGPW